MKAITTTTDSSRTSFEALNTTQDMRSTSSSFLLYSSFSTSTSVSSEPEPALFVGGVQSSSGGIAAITEYMLWIIFIIYAFVQ